MGQFADPIFSNGQYPAAMQEDISSMSLAEGYLTNRLPKFTNDEITHIRNSADFFALNCNAEIKVYGKNYKESDPSSIYKDAGVEPIFKEGWNVSSSWIKVVKFHETLSYL